MSAPCAQGLGWRIDERALCSGFRVRIDERARELVLGAESPVVSADRAV